LNAVVFFALTVLLVLSLLSATSSYFHYGEPKVKVLRLDKLTKLSNRGGADIAMLDFDVSADLREAFHWNIKQLFVFVVAEYESDKNSLNQVIIWDKIIEEKDLANIRLKKEHMKYALLAQGEDLRDRNITLKLMYDHMPLTGRLYTQTSPKTGSFVTPSQLLLPSGGSSYSSRGSRR